MVAARRVFVRPKIDEECPEWARDLIPFSEQEHGLGIPCDRIPPATLEELEYFFPVPVPPKRQRRIGSQQEGKKYARTSGLAVFLACLPYALAKQLDLFSDADGVGTGEVAVLGFRKLADLAKKVGMSYDRLQRWMTILITLGFIWRFRDGKRSLYVIPLTAFVPRPSAEGVRTKLTALIHSQFVELEQADGQVIRAARCPEFTNLLIEIRARFELRYQLDPSLGLVEDPAWENILRDIQQAIPALTRADLYTILPIVARQLLQQGGTGKGRHFVLKGTTIESTLSREAISDRERKGASLPGPQKGNPAQKGRSEAGRRSGTASTVIDQTLHASANTEAMSGAENSARSQKSGADRRGGKGRFNQEVITAPVGVRPASQEAGALTDGRASDGQNLPLPDGSSSLTLRSPVQEDSSPDEAGANGMTISGREQGAKQESWSALAAEIAPLLDDQKSLKFYEGVCRSTEEPLVRAIFIKTLYQGRNGGFTRSAGAYFKYMWEQWKVYRTYAAACAKWNHWGNKRDPKGIPPNIKDLVALHQLDSYEQIAASMGYSVAETGREAWPPASTRAERPAHPMTGSEAELLVARIKRQAAWYLSEPQVVPETTFGPDAYVVDAQQWDGSWVTFPSVEDWKQSHAWMLTPPQEYDSWLEATAEERWHTLSSEEDGMSAGDKELCLRCALALSAYLGWDIAACSWHELVALGKPLAFPGWDAAQGQEALAAAQDPQDTEISVGQNGLQVRLDEGVVLTGAAYEQAFQAGEAARAEEEWEWSPEGALALLQREVLLALHLCILGTFGLPMYQAFLAQTAARAAEGEPERGAPRAEDLPTSPARGGTRSALTLASYSRLSRALDPRLYCVKWVPGSEKTGCAIEVESLLSGTVFTYEHDAQVEELLAELREQLAGERGEGDLQHR